MRSKSNNIYVPSSLGVVVATCVVWQNYGSRKYAPHTQLLCNSSPTIPEGLWRFFKTTYNTNNSNSVKGKKKKKKQLMLMINDQRTESSQTF